MKNKLKVAIVLVLSVIASILIALNILMECPYVQEKYMSVKADKPYVKTIPCYEDYLRIAANPYEVNVYDCSNKTFELFNILLKNGYNPKIVCTYRRGDGAGHAFLWLEEFGFLDPTWNRTYNIKKSISPIYDYYKNNMYYIYGDITELYDKSNISERLDEFNNEFN